MGIGDVYAVAGESNASGRSPTPQAYDPAQTLPLRPALFGNDYNFQVLQDPYDSTVSQVDAVSKESVGNPAQGSIWPLLSTSYIVRTSIPIMFIPCALGGTRISQWQPGASHTDRTTLYGSCVFRIQQQPNSVKAVLMWLGENDMNANTTQTAFATGLQSFSDAIFADTGAPTVVPLNLTLPAGSLVSGTEQAAINAAISSSWGSHHVLAGPDLTVITCDSGDFFHIFASTLLQQAAGLWQTALNAAFGL